MTTPIDVVCTAPRCGRSAFCRGLCNSHYYRAWRDKALDLVALPSKVRDRAEHHRIANVDRDARLGDCSICGPGVRVRMRARHSPECIAVVARYRGPRRKPSPFRGLGVRERKLRRDYGITEVEYEAMVAGQGGQCAICQKPPSEEKRLVVDHCHKTGRVRGALCALCNSAIAFMRDNPDAALRASIYLVQK